MIQLKDETSVALLINLMKHEYNKSWYTRDGEFLIVGIHSPTGEIAYKIPFEYAKYFQGMIYLEEADNLEPVTGQECVDHLLDWAVSL
jgi:hypothetical protein